MIKREDFIFTVGYQGDTAIVNANSKRKFSRLGTRELAEKGFFKAAICSALYAGSDEELEQVMKIYNEQNEKTIDSIHNLKRIFGVSHVPEGIEKILHI
ncbi:MAG: hypothetical protein JW822_08135 [Spirochaetales bacterium]|nr:hypothetical protein [Spirochaetales bacterium]